MDKSFINNIKEKQLVAAEAQFKESVKAKISEKLANEKAKVIKTINESLDEVNRDGISNPGLDALAAKKKAAKKKKDQEDAVKPTSKQPIQDR